VLQFVAVFRRVLPRVAVCAPVGSQDLAGTFWTKSWSRSFTPRLSKLEYLIGKKFYSLFSKKKAPGSLELQNLSEVNFASRAKLS